VDQKTIKASIDNKALLKPGAILKDLDFDKILSRCAEHALSEDARQSILESKIYTHRNFIQESLQRVHEMKEFCVREPLNLIEYHNILKELKSLRIQNYTLGIEDIVKIKVILQNLRMISHALGHLAWHHLELLLKDLSKIPDLKFITDRIDKIFAVDGKVKDDASPALKIIRDQLRNKQNEIYRTFKKQVAQYRSSGFLAEGEESIRNGRLVLRVLVEHRRKIKGIIHDESDSGKTVFLEPQELVELNNDIFELESEERKEIFRILADLCNLMRPYVEDIEQSYLLLVNWDILLAKTRLAISLEAVLPVLSNSDQMNLKNARHPLLFLKLKEAQKKLVPASLSLNAKNRILLISGPNAGGKSIILKTVGLLQCMLQAGFLVPVDKHSEFKIFKKIFADIGDHQSLDDALSTYSARLSYMRDFEVAADGDTLILLDEFGSGTEPQIGGAIAEALLQALNRRKVYGIFNTHYANLKAYAHQNEGLINGAMLFDEKNLSPTYQLQTGRPGSSYALEIAEKIQLPLHLIDYAKKKVGKQTVSFESLLANLDKENSKLLREIEEYKKKKSELDKLIRNYQDLQKQFEYKKLKLKLEQKQTEIQSKSSKHRELENYVKELRKEKDLELAKTKAEQEKIRLQKEHEELLNINTEYQKLSGHDVNAPLKTGDAVKLVINGMIGQVEKIEKDLITVVTEHMTFKLKRKELIKLKSNIDVKLNKSVKSDLERSSAAFNPVLDLRGMHLQEAQSMLEVYIDKALLANVNQVHIVHGKGSGILRQTVSKSLRGQRYVKSIGHPAEESGGDSITVVEFK
jgi:DNA mismatch repair protein MutS2